MKVLNRRKVEREIGIEPPAGIDLRSNKDATDDIPAFYTRLVVNDCHSSFIR